MKLKAEVRVVRRMDDLKIAGLSRYYGLRTDFKGEGFGLSARYT